MTDTLSIDKGAKINIEKVSGGKHQFVIGLGWNTDADLDASAFLCKQDSAGGNATCVGKPGVVYFGQKEAPGIKHLGDALSGEGNAAGEPDEYITLDCDKLQPDVDQVEVWANIYKSEENGLTFGKVKDAFISIFVGKDDGAGNLVPDGAPIVKYNLSEDYFTDTAVQFGSIYKADGQWRFHATPDGGNKLSIRELINSYVPGAV